MPIDPSRLCECHGVPMCLTVDHDLNKDGSNRNPYHICVVKRRERVIKYQQTRKGRAARKRASHSSNARRVFVGKRYLGMSADAERLNAHIKGRVCEFKQGFAARAKTEGI